MYNQCYAHSQQHRRTSMSRFTAFYYQDTIPGVPLCQHYLGSINSKPIALLQRLQVALPHRHQDWCSAHPLHSSRRRKHSNEDMLKVALAAVVGRGRGEVRQVPELPKPPSHHRNPMYEVGNIQLLGLTPAICKAFNTCFWWKLGSMNPKCLGPHCMPLNNFGA